MSDLRAVADADTFFAACPIPPRIFEFRAWVHRVYDGDTSVVWVEEGDGKLVAIRLRYEHVNCPEMSAVGGPEAADYNRALCDGKWIIIRTRWRRDQNGRLLGDPFLWVGKNVPPLDITASLIEAGHGTKR